METGRDIFLIHAVVMTLTTVPNHMPHEFPLGGAVKQVKAYQNGRGTTLMKNMYILACTLL